MKAPAEEEVRRHGAGKVKVNCLPIPVFPLVMLISESVFADRYLLCEVNVSDRSSLLHLDDRAVAATVKAAVARTHGDYGAALCSIRFCGEGK